MRVELIIVQYEIHVHFHNQAGFDKLVINRRGLSWAFQRWSSFFKSPNHQKGSRWRINNGS